MVMRTLGHRTAGLIGAALAAAALGLAFATEWWGGLVPCPLCLWERWPYRIAIVVGLLTALAPIRMRKPVLMGLLVVLLAAAWLAAIHTGVEFHWWPSPLPACSATVLFTGSVAERLAALPALPAKPCDEPTYLVPFLPVSMAAMNLLFALGLAGFIGFSLRGRTMGR